MIRAFKSKASADLFQSGKTAKIDQRMHKRIRVRLDVINEAVEIAEINVPGYNFHSLSGAEREVDVSRIPTLEPA
jgi:proteic killer suppression protein